MSKIFILFIYLCLVLNTNGQVLGKKQISLPQKNYFSLQIGSSIFFANIENGAEQINFPYLIKTVNGNIIDTSFSSSKFAPAEKTPVALNFNFEIGNLKHFFELKFGGYLTQENEIFIVLGYGRNFFVSFFQKHQTENKLEKNLVIKPSLQFGYYSLNKKLGTIDNVNKYIYIDSYTSGPTFTETYSDGDGNSTDETFATQTLDVDYLQRSFRLNPKIAIGNNPYKNAFYCEFFVSTYFTLSEAIGAKFVQESSGNNHNQSSGFYSFGTNGINATFNGSRIIKAPFRSSGFEIGFSAGITNAIDKNKKHLKKS
jgi:hypothetical protein